MRDPRISVVMSVFNGEAHVDDAIQSILAQSVTDFEFVIVDDGSYDATPEILARYAALDSRVRVIINEHNIGLTQSLNRGLDRAHGEFIARQDADDRSLPERFTRQLAWFDANPDGVLLGSAYHVGSDKGPVHRPPTQGLDIRWQMLFHNAFCHSSVMFRSAPIVGAGVRYDASLRFAQDYDMWARVQKIGLSENLEAPLVILGVHDARISVGNFNSQQHSATGIAKRQMSELLGAVLPAMADVAILRGWYNKFPKCLSSGEFPTAKLVLDLLDALPRLPPSETPIVKRLERSWRRKILSAIQITDVLAAHKAGLVASPPPFGALQLLYERMINLFRRVRLLR